MIEAEKIGVKQTQPQGILIAKSFNNYLKGIIQLHLKEIEHKRYRDELNTHLL